MDLYLCVVLWPSFPSPSLWLTSSEVSYPHVHVHEISEVPYSKTYIPNREETTPGDDFMWVPSLAGTIDVPNIHLYMYMYITCISLQSLSPTLS